jgi:hypothetical protein
MQCFLEQGRSIREIYPDHTQPAFEWMERVLMRRWRVDATVCPFLTSAKRMQVLCMCD